MMMDLVVFAVVMLGMPAVVLLVIACDARRRGRSCLT
jgi:hypothetical protein